MAIGFLSFNNSKVVQSTLLKNSKGRVILGMKMLMSRRNKMTLNKIYLVVEKCALPYVIPAATAKQVRKALEEAYEDIGLNRQLKLFYTLCSVKLQLFKNMKQIINVIMHLSH